MSDARSGLAGEPAAALDEHDPRPGAGADDPTEDADGDSAPA